MHVPINVKSPNNTSKWQIGFNLDFKGLNKILNAERHFVTVHKNFKRYSLFHFCSLWNVRFKLVSCNFFFSVEVSSIASGFGCLTLKVLVIRSGRLVQSSSIVPSQMPSWILFSIKKKLRDIFLCHTVSYIHVSKFCPAEHMHGFNRPIIQFCRHLVGRVAQNERNFILKISHILFISSKSYFFLSYRVLGKGYWYLLTP
jgi:hypothetical protein